MLQYLKEEYQEVDKDTPIYFNFVDENGYIELILPQEQPSGWRIIPTVKPCKVYIDKLIIKVE